MSTQLDIPKLEPITVRCVVPTAPELISPWRKKLEDACSYLGITYDEVCELPFEQQELKISEAYIRKADAKRAAEYKAFKQDQAVDQMLNPHWYKSVTLINGETAVFEKSCSKSIYT